jgi:hypothetical protein
MNDFTKAYIECMRWARGEDEVDLTVYDLESIIDDCNDFQNLAHDLMKGLDVRQCGHDFYLTRNGHGSGFWDRGYDAQLSDALCAICNEFGDSYEGL